MHRKRMVGIDHRARNHATAVDRARPVYLLQPGGRHPVGMALPLERRPVDKESRIPTSFFHELAVGLARALVKHQGLWVGQREQKCQHRRKRLATEALDAILELAPRIQALHADERRQVSDVIALHPLEPANEVKVHLGGGLLVSLGDGGMVALGGGAAPRADAADGRLDRGGYVGARRLALLALQQRVGVPEVGVKDDVVEQVDGGIVCLLGEGALAQLV
mmetsp:Transcript_54583/g.119034  ORF Transcript_54583/g.119034 Transcript_54583/m.119034 type:complete len:221 (+) Transcript_54583:252-914(+)